MTTAVELAGGGRHTRATSITAGSPTSGQMRTSRSGMRACSSARQASAGLSGLENSKRHGTPPRL